MRVLVTGSRLSTYPPAPIWDALSALDAVAKEKGETMTLVVGDCPTGVDVIAKGVAARLGWTVDRHVARWNQYGAKAGPKRNQAMVESGADLAIGFPSLDSTGTWDCAKRAKKAGIPLTLIDMTGKLIELDGSGYEQQ